LKEPIRGHFEKLERKKYDSEQNRLGESEVLIALENFEESEVKKFNVKETWN
jgi:hypothetical protein